MVHATGPSDCSKTLLSRASEEKFPVFERTIVECKDISDRFKHGTKDFSRQFFHVYFLRLQALTEPLSKKVEAKWG